jgi:hypothetical protein
MTRSRSFTGTVTTAVLVVVFGNQVVSDWIVKHVTGDDVLSWLVKQLIAPSWSVDFSGSSDEVRSVVARDVRAGLTILFVYVLLVAFRKTFPEGFSGFILGWSTLIFASAVAAFAAAFIMPGAFDVVRALDSTGPAALYGLFVGWIVGFIVSVGRNIPIIGKTRSTTAA